MSILHVITMGGSNYAEATGLAIGMGATRKWLVIGFFCIEDTYGW